MFRVMDRYLMKESTIGMFTWVGAVTIVMLVQTIFELADFFVNKRVPLLIVLEILLLYIPAHMVMTFPISGLLASQLTLSRLCRESELVAIEAGGVSLKRFLQPFLIFGLFVSLGAYAINDFVVPEANHRAQVLIREFVYKEGPPRIEQNVFFRDADNRYFYVGEIDNESWELRNIIIYELGTRHDYPDVILAQTGLWQDEHWILREGVTHRYNELGHLIQEIEFSEMVIDMREELKDFFTRQRSPEELSSRDLSRQIDILRQAGAATENYEVAYYLKMAIPFSAFVFLLFGMPLGIQRTRDPKALGVIVTVLMAFVYNMLLSITRSLGRGGVMEPWLAAWLPDILFGVLGLILFVTVDRK
ncbi:MAG TPA: LptF/LptG family permease [Atribacteraceae bacterium]|nr:LptF/LptG family permease [Atribacteraceae bacterium]